MISSLSGKVFGLALTMSAATFTYASLSLAETRVVQDVPDVTKPAKTTFLTIDASDKTIFHYFALDKGTLVEVTEADAWILGVRRYIFKTQTGSNGVFAGGAYDAPLADFSSFQGCDAKKFVQDEVVTMLGYTISANQLMTDWYDYNEEGSIGPKDLFYAIGRDTECLKFKINSYVGGVYEVEYSQIH